MVDLPQAIPSIVIDPDDDPILQTAIVGRADRGMNTSSTKPSNASCGLRRRELADLQRGCNESSFHASDMPVSPSRSASESTQVPPIATICPIQ